MLDPFRLINGLPTHCLFLRVDFDIHRKRLWLTFTPNRQSHEVGKRCVSSRNQIGGPRRASDPAGGKYFLKMLYNPQVQAPLDERPTQDRKEPSDVTTLVVRRLESRR